mgnify:CR=1 FL=1
MTCNSSAEQLSCTSCVLHTQGRTQVVPGHGSSDAKIAFVGEAPGADEDREGLPFIGKAGERFNQQLEAMGIKREDCWIDNRVKCRPPNNQLRAYPDAVVKCPQLWLMPTLASIRPHVVVTLGATAGDLWFPGIKATALSQLARAVTTDYVTGIVINDGQVIRKWSYVVVGAFHPSFALRHGPFPNSVDSSIMASMARASYYSGLMELQR